MLDMGGRVVIIGAGPAGMESAGQLAKSGFTVAVLEKNPVPGGHVRNWFHLFPDSRSSSEVIKYLEKQLNHSGITFLANTTAEKLEKKHGSFMVHTSSGKELDADAVLVSTGFDLFRSERKEEYGYGIYDNVISSADLEKMFHEGGPKRTDGTIPAKIGMVHCVGSRDEKVGNLFCSKLCCVTAVKQAIEIKKLNPAAKVFCFYMDMRMGGAHYEELYRESQENYGVNYIRGKVSEVSESVNRRLVVKVEDTLAGRPLKMELDMLVLMAGMEMSEDGARIAGSSGLKTGDNNFFAVVDNHMGSNIGNVKGVFYAGTCTAPMNITETIAHARSAVADIIDYLAEGKR